MKFNKIEKQILRYLLESTGVLSSENSSILEGEFEMEREISRGGFITDIQPTNALKFWNHEVNMRWSDVGAHLNKEKIDTGYLVFVDDGCLTGIEGYTYEGVSWPEVIDEVELYDLVVQIV